MLLFRALATLIKKDKELTDAQYMTASQTKNKNLIPAGSHP